MNVRIIGHGAWGSALQQVITENKQAFLHDALILAVPTQSLRPVLEKEKGSIVPNTAIINCSKGIEKDSHLLPFQIVQDVLGQSNYFSLIGPSFAGEVVDRMPTLVCLGYTKNIHGDAVRDLFQTAYLRVIPTSGVAALELLGAFKNVYAIAAGLTDGLGFGMNTRAKIIGLAYQEFLRLAKVLDYKIEESAIPAIVGDLVLTCNSTESRNFTFGKLLAKHLVEECLRKVGTTVEGYHTTASVGYFQGKSGVSLHVAMLVKESIQDNNPTLVRERFTTFVEHV